MGLFEDIHVISEAMMTQAKAIESEAKSLESIAESLKSFVVHALNLPVGGVVSFKEPSMAAKPKISLKKSTGGIQPKAASPKAGPPVNYVMLDTGTGAFTVLGEFADGTSGDISAIASITSLTSDNTAVATVDPPTGMSSAVHAVPPPGTANLLITFAANDGSFGPFNITQPLTTTTGGVTGGTVQFGTPSLS